MILGDDLQQGGVGGGFGVEIEPSVHLDPDVAIVIAVAAAFKKLLNRDPLRNHVADVAEESVFLTGVQLDGAEGVTEVEAVYDDAGIVGVSAGTDDVHAPGGQNAGDVRKQAGAVAGNHRQIKELA